MKTLLRTFLLLIIFLIGGITFLLTPTGLRWSIDFSKQFLPGKLSIQKISGVIVGPITLENIRYEDSDDIITVKKVRVNWQPIQLIHHKLHINIFDVDQLHITLKKNAPDLNWNEEKIRAEIKNLITYFQTQHTPLRILINQALFTDFTLANADSKKHQLTIQKIFFRGLIEKKGVDIALSTKIIKPITLNFSLAVDGSLAHYHLSSLLTGVGTNLQLIGQGNTNTFLFQTKENKFLNGTLNANFTMQHAPFLKWTGQLNTKNINPSLLNPEWINHLFIDIKSSGDEKNAFMTHNDIHIKTDKGLLRVLLNYDNTLKIDWDLKTEALSRWIPVLTGSLNSHGHIEGDLDNPFFRIVLSTKFKTDNVTLNNAKLIADGTLKNHKIDFAATAPGQMIKLALKGGYAHDKWTGELYEFTMNLFRNTHWQLAKSVPITVSSEKASLGNLCLHSEKAGNICMKGEWSPKKILGELKIHLSHFGWLRSFLPTIHIAAGAADANLRLSGTLKNPNLTGTVNFPGARFVFPHLKVSLDQLKATFSSKPHQLLFDVTAFSAKTPVHLKGFVDLTKPVFTAEGILTANNLLFINTEEYVAYATAQLTANIQGNNIVITGNINIPKATIHPNDFKTTVTLPDHDIIFVGGDTPPPKPFWNLQNDMTITLGNDININASGVTAQLGGSIQINQPTPNADAIANGEIFVRNGVYNVYGQTLKITSDSSLIFSDSLLNNPSLDVRATKTVQAIENLGNGAPNFTRNTLLVGIEITGTVKSPKITFFSNRSSLSEADILSYILFGYANTSNTPGNTDFLLRALAAVNISSQGLMGKQNIAGQIQRGLGLNEMGVESETTTDALGNPLNQQSSFVVGKSLTRKFYVRYSVGILDPVNVFEVRYLLNNNWALQANSSTLGNGADVLYTIQKN